MQSVDWAIEYLLGVPPGESPIGRVLLYISESSEGPTNAPSVVVDATYAGEEGYGSRSARRTKAGRSL